MKRGRRVGSTEISHAQCPTLVIRDCRLARAAWGPVIGRRGFPKPVPMGQQAAGCSEILNRFGRATQSQLFYPIAANRPNQHIPADRHNSMNIP